MRGTAETPDLILSGEIGVNKTVNTESINIYENGNYTPPTGVDGYDDIHVDVRPVIDQITIRENGTYEASGEVDGYAPVVVNVPQSAAKVYAKNINANGNYYPDAGYDGFSQVSVNVPETPLRPLNVTENGEYNPPSGEGYSKVVVDVPTAPEIESITITQNGTYTAPTGVDGYSPVIVNVPQPEDAYYIKDMTPGAIASFDDGADMVLPSLTASIVPVQAGSGDPNPTNVRPISGWTEEVIEVSGKNNFNPNSILVGSYANNVWTISDYTNYQKAFDYTFKANQQYTFSGKATQDLPNKNLRLQITYTDGTTKNLWSTNATTTEVFEVTSDEGKTVDSVVVRYGGSGGTVIVEDFQIELGTTSTTYEPYAGTTTTIQFTDGDNPLIVYGGTLDVTSGVLTVDSYGITITGTESFIYKNSNVASIYGLYVDSFPGRPYFRGDSASAIDRGVCSMFKKAIYLPSDQMQDHTIDSYGGGFGNTGLVGSWIRFKESSFADYTIEQAKAKLAEFYTNNQPLQIVFPMVAKTYQLTPTSIKSLDGENNVFASTGDVLSGSYFSETPA